MRISERAAEFALARKGLTMRQVAGLSGLSPTTVGKAFAGGDVRPDVVGLVARVLAVDVAELVASVGQKVA